MFRVFVISWVEVKTTSRSKFTDVFADLRRKFNTQFEEAQTTSVEKTIDIQETVDHIISADEEKRGDLNKTFNSFEEDKSVQDVDEETADYKKMSEDDDTVEVSIPSDADSSMAIFNECSSILKINSFQQQPRRTPSQDELLVEKVSETLLVDFKTHPSSSTTPNQGIYSEHF